MIDPARIKKIFIVAVFILILLTLCYARVYEPLRLPDRFVVELPQGSQEN